MAPPKKSISNAIQRAKAVILKQTGQKSIQPTTTVMPHIPTGSMAVDMLIGGTMSKDGKGPICPGFPRRRITEVYGPESSGKTTLSLSAIAQAQKAGGTAFFIDFEHALDLNYAQALGVSLDEDKWGLYQPDSMEEGLTMAYIGIAAGVDIIVVDSVAGMVPKDEFEKKFDEAAKIGIVAAKLASALPKFVMWLQKLPHDEFKEKSDPNSQGTSLVLLNQTRAVITSGPKGYGGDTENTSGGKALKFFSYLRIRMQRIKSEIIEKKDPITGKPKRLPYGNLTDVKLVKSKVDGKQGHSTQVFIRYGFGIDDYFSIIEAGVLYKLIKKESSWFVLGGQRFQGRDKFRQYLIANPQDFSELRDKLIKLVGSSGVQAVDDDDLSEEDSILEALQISSEDDDLDIIEKTLSEEVVEDAAE